MFKNLIQSAIIFTDLDGTLLNHSDYSYDSAKFILNFIKENEIPLIIATSKTKNEVIELQKYLGISTPFIVENGGGIIFHKKDGYEDMELGYNYQYIRDCFKKYAKKYKIRGFGDMGIEEIMTLTGLPFKQSKEAKSRLFSEPFVLENENDFTALKKLANSDDLDIVKGGRFYHLITLNQDKSVAVKKLIKLYETNNQKKYHSIALGDSANDLGMLQAVDTAVLIPQIDNSYIKCDIKNIKKAPFPGPDGWNIALREIFNV